MTITEIHRKYSTKLKCNEYLEKLRWGKTVKCTKCESIRVTRISGEIGRFHCNSCETTFSTITNTIFEYSGLELPKWFIIIGLMLNAKKGMSSKEIMRNVGTTYKSAWYAAMRVRCAMIDLDNVELDGVTEMDETYLGGKPRKKYSSDPSEPNLSKVTNKRGRGTKKTPVVGIVERKGKIVLRVIEKLTTRNLLSMLKENVKTDTSIVVTDEFKSYHRFDEVIQHYTVDHSKKEWVKGMMHTNTIEGFWAIIKNSIRGNYIAISKKYLPFYLVQAQYVYNYRDYSGNLFEKFLKQAVNVDKSDYMMHYKPVKDTKKLIYKT